jgi:hypothetical protein
MKKLTISAARLILLSVERERKQSGGIFWLDSFSEGGVLGEDEEQVPRNTWKEVEVLFNPWKRTAS